MSEGSDGRAWSAFWLAVLGNSTDFLSIFFVCDLNSCILIKTSRVQEKGQAILSPYLLFCSRAEKQSRANLSSTFLFSILFSYEILDLGRTWTFAYARRLNPCYGSS